MQNANSSTPGPVLLLPLVSGNGAGCPGDQGPFLWGQGEKRCSQQGQLLQMGAGVFSHRKKCLAGRHRACKSSRAESLMTLGVAAGVRGRGFSKSAQVFVKGRDATDLQDLVPIQGDKDAVQGLNRLGSSLEVKK